MTVYFGFAFADSMIPGDALLRRKVLSQEEAVELIHKGVEPCLNPSHKATIDAMAVRCGIVVPIPPTAPKVELKVGDSVIVLSVRGLPRLDATRHEYTAEEIAKAAFVFSLWTRIE